MSNNLPALALGHFVIKVNDIGLSYEFYTKLGLRPFGLYPDGGIVELRGGTHILLLSKTEALTSPIAASHIGQRGASFAEHLDLMIDGKTKEDLEAYRESLIEKGFSVNPITEENLFGHRYFELLDLDGNGITVYTSHKGKLPV